MNNPIDLLVIDDDAINVFITRKTVARTGFKVNMISKCNGQDAIDYLNGLIQNHQPLPNLIFIDINMPVMNGWQFLKAYDQLGIKVAITIYMLTSSVFHLDVEKAKSFTSVKGFISKPLLIDQFIEVLEKINEESVCCD